MYVFWLILQLFFFVNDSAGDGRGVEWVSAFRFHFRILKYSILPMWLQNIIYLFQTLWALFIILNYNKILDKF